MHVKQGPRSHLFLQWKQWFSVSGLRGFESLDVSNDNPRPARRQPRRPARDHLPRGGEVLSVMASRGFNEIPPRRALRDPSGIRHVGNLFFKKNHDLQSESFFMKRGI
ncbi:hypothetical protein [Burkholderia plantarii]|uniref:hypothetical protein n=1 Tax=Burkholderia plantarii TaxID=41899 RepID=UPI00114CC36C|nr:hypothetical protein [Burkholderia plantarii]